jgi:hypothetical protein
MKNLSKIKNTPLQTTFERVTIERAVHGYPKMGESPFLKICSKGGERARQVLSHQDVMQRCILEYLHWIQLAGSVSLVCRSWLFLTPTVIQRCLVRDLSLYPNVKQIPRSLWPSSETLSKAFAKNANLHAFFNEHFSIADAMEEALPMEDDTKKDAPNSVLTTRSECEMSYSPWLILLAYSPILTSSSTTKKTQKGAGGPLLKKTNKGGSPCLKKQKVDIKEAAVGVEMTGMRWFYLMNNCMTNTLCCLCGLARKLGKTRIKFKIAPGSFPGYRKKRGPLAVCEQCTQTKIQSDYYVLQHYGISEQAIRDHGGLVLIRPSPSKLTEKFFLLSDVLYISNPPSAATENDSLKKKSQKKISGKEKQAIESLLKMA